MLVKNVVGSGSMAKSIKLQVFMTPKKYMEIVNEARVYNIVNKTDSGLIDGILDKFLSDLPLLRLERDRMKAALTEKNAVIDQLRNEIQDLKTKKKVKK